MIHHLRMPRVSMREKMKPMDRLRTLAADPAARPDTDTQALADSRAGCRLPRHRRLTDDQKAILQAAAVQIMRGLKP